MVLSCPCSSRALQRMTRGALFLVLLSSGCSSPRVDDVGDESPPSSVGMGPGATEAGLPPPVAQDGGAPPLSDAALAADCTSDVDCNHGETGAGLVCATVGSEAGQCIEGCHSPLDCPAGERCDESTTPHWSCVPADGGIATEAGATNGCPVLAYPSGVHLQTFPDATTSASYAAHLDPGQVAPACFLDTDRLIDPIADATYDLSVAVSSHFTLNDVVGTEIAQGYGHFVLMNPAAVGSLEAFRGSLDVAVDVISGYRSPKHQEDVCEGLCGDPLGCSGTCANNSRHLWGDAFDLPLAFYTKPDEDLACSVGFTFAYLESGTHLHVDQNPAYATCVEE